MNISFERFKKGHGQEPKSDIEGYVTFYINVSFRDEHLKEWEKKHTCFVCDRQSMEEKMIEFGKHFCSHWNIRIPITVELLP